MKKRIAWLLMIVLFFCNFQTPIIYASSNSPYSATAYGDLDVTLKFDYPIKYVDANHTNMYLTLLNEDKEVSTFDLGRDITKQSFMIDGKPYHVSIKAQDQDSHLLTYFDEEVAAYHIHFDKLPIGNYKIELGGNGYKPYISGTLSLNQYEKHLIVNTANATFTAGDTNQDGLISEIDLSALEKALEENQVGPTYDLNRDGLIDITDFTYVFRNQSATGDATLLDTKLIPATTINVGESNSALLADPSIVVTGSLENILDAQSNQTLTLQSKNGVIDQSNPINIPIVLNEPIVMQQITMTTPPDESGISEGFIFIETEDGAILPPVAYKGESFNQPMLLRSAYAVIPPKEIVINLGKQVAVKKITISVTGTIGSKDSAVISEVKFLKDIADDAINQETGEIKNFTATSGNESVLLTWNRVPNATSYEVQYGTESGLYTHKLSSSKTSLAIDGLENYEEYFFVVRAVNGEWQGPLSLEIMAMPKPTSIPAPPGNLSLIEKDSAITIKWGSSEGATSYNLYYRKEADRAYTKVSHLVSTSYELVGLENDTPYLVYVTAVNAKGESKPSAELVGTPYKQEIKDPLIPTYNRLMRENIKNIELVNKNNINLPHYPNGFDINNIVDGDFSTHWTAKGWGHLAAVQVTFDKPYDMNYVVYSPRLDGDYPKVVSFYYIKVWEDENSEPEVLVPNWTFIPGDAGSIASKGYAVLPFPKSKVHKIEVGIRQWDGSPAQSLPTISELNFYEYYGVDEDLTNLFTDTSFTELKSGVTLEEIEAIEQAILGIEGQYFVDQDILLEEIKMAKALYHGETDALGPVVTVDNWRNASSDRDRQFSYTLNDYQPVGAAVIYEQDKLNKKYPDHIVAYVNNPSGGTLPKLVFTQYYGEASRWNTSVQLTNGRNVIEIPKLTNYRVPVGGSIYLQYSGASSDIEVHLEGVTKLPNLYVPDIGDPSKEDEIKALLNKYVTTLTEHVSRLTGKADVNPLNATEIGTDKVLLSLPATQVLNGLGGKDASLEDKVNRLYNGLVTWDKTMNLHYEIAGLTPDATESKNQYPSSRINIRYMRMTDAFMYAGGAHIGIGYGSASSLVGNDPDAASGYFGWGINHEIGHVLDLPRRTYAESTNNIFSLFAQTVNDGPSRLETSNKYEAIYQKIVAENPGMATDVFVSLGLFWQLHLAYDYDDFTGSDAFYPRLHRAYRDTNEGITSTEPGVDGKMNLFVRTASDVIGKDLTPFFEKWDIKISEETKAHMRTKGYEKEERPIYYLNDEARRYKLNGGSGLSDISFDVNATVLDQDAHLDPSVEININLQHPEDAAHILGYEIYRNNKLIAFTTDTTYVDEIGTANNISLEYTVVAYDYLLNASDEVTTPEVSIAFDGTLDKTNWTYETIPTTSGSALIIDTKSNQSMTGLKVSDVNVTTSSALTVLVSTDGKNWTSAKSTYLNDGNNYQYFNKPGTDSDDQRIWTYDARYVQLVGDVIGDLQPSQIDLIAYPGDAIYFIEDGIGKLKYDFYIGDDDLENGTLKAGTLVVAGKYRGNPAFNGMQILGKYLTETHGGEAEIAESVLPGEMYLFTEIPEDNQVSTIDNGIWLFVPSDQNLISSITETEDAIHEETLHVLTAIKAQMYRTDDTAGTGSKQFVSDTPWIIPTQESLITLK